jgi:KDO2-lipid IV(A) lauroyltransferase
MKKVSGPLIYYALLWPLSKMPFWFLNGMSGVLYFFLFYIIGYRRQVVQENLKNSFPEKSEAERKKIENQFYRHLSDVFMDGIKAFNISKDELREHLVCKNPELIRKYYDQGKEVVVTVGHFGSWEIFLTGINLYIRHRAVVIYQPLRNEYLDRKLREKRSEYRTLMLPTKEVKRFFAAPRKEICATVFAIDQSPPHPDRCYWMNFLHQDTGVLFGAEKYAKEYDMPVVYARLTRENRGYWSLEFVEVEEHPKEAAHGSITERASRLLEADIRSNPALWLWSHKRWKHKRF